MSIFVNEYMCVTGWLFFLVVCRDKGGGGVGWGGFSGTVTEAKFLLRKRKQERDK